MITCIVSSGCSRKKVDMFNHRCEKPWMFYSNMSGGHHPMVRHHPSTPKSHRGSAPRLGFSKPRKLLGLKTEFQPPMRRPQVFQCLSESLLTMWDITTGWWLTYHLKKYEWKSVGMMKFQMFQTTNQLGLTWHLYINMWGYKGYMGLVMAKFIDQLSDFVFFGGPCGVVTCHKP